MTFLKTMTLMMAMILTPLALSAHGGDHWGHSRTKTVSYGSFGSGALSYGSFGTASMAQSRTMNWGSLGSGRARTVNKTFFTHRAGPRRARWTWPGNLRTHLQGPPHYMNTSGMTFSRMVQVHDSHHDRIGPVRFVGGRAVMASRNTAMATRRLLGRLVW